MMQILFKTLLFLGVSYALLHANELPLSPTKTLEVDKTFKVKSGKEFFKDASFVGAQACKECHASHYDDWSKTWHAKMEKLPDPKIIIGDFNNRILTYKNVTVKDQNGTESKVTYKVKAFREGDDFFFTVLDQDDISNNQTYKIDKVLGGNWDQQYEVKIGENNYLPTMLRWSVKANDWLISSYNPQDWVEYDGTADGKPRTLKTLPKDRVAEAKCSNCHTTGFEFAKDKQDNVWKIKHEGELGISCEKCHGPGSKHIQEAKDAKMQGKTLVASLTTTIHPLKDLNALQQTQICSQCHGRGTNKEIKEVSFPLGFLPGDTNINDHLMFWSYSGTASKDQSKYFYTNDWAKRNRQQTQDFLKSAHANQADMSCLTCHSFHGKSESYQLRQEPQKLCTECHTATGTAKRPNQEMFKGSPMEKAGVKCIDCHMSKIGYRSDKTEKTPHQWDVSSHTFMVSTPELSKNTGMRSSCVSCHTSEGEPTKLSSGITPVAYDNDTLSMMLKSKQADTKKSIQDIQALLAKVKSDKKEVKALVDQANAKINFVLLDGSYGFHNTEKTNELLNEAMNLAKKAQAK